MQNFTEWNQTGLNEELNPAKTDLNEELNPAKIEFAQNVILASLANLENIIKNFHNEVKADRKIIKSQFSDTSIHASEDKKRLKRVMEMYGANIKGLQDNLQNIKRNMDKLY